MKKVVSLSGGLTSATLIDTFGTDADYIFVNTGFEHPNTYRFITMLATFYKINLVCLEPVVREMGVSNTYKVVSLASLGMNFQIMKDHVIKYGGFTVGNPHCSERMKTVVVEAYKKDKYKNVDIEHVLGFRVDEQRRMLGKNGYSLLRSLGYTQDDVIDLKLKWCRILKEQGVNALESHLNSLFAVPTKETLRQIKSLVVKVKFLVKHNIHYMAEYSDKDKQDVTDFWSKMPFTLNIQEHEGNCLYCVKKDRKKVALSVRDNPEFVDAWNEITECRREMPSYDGDRQYRFPGAYVTLNDVISEFSDIETEELRRFVYKNKNKEDDGCTSSCDPFGGVLDYM